MAEHQIKYRRWLQSLPRAFAFSFDEQCSFDVALSQRRSQDSFLLVSELRWREPWERGWRCGVKFYAAATWI